MVKDYLIKWYSIREKKIRKLKFGEEALCNSYIEIHLKCEMLNGYTCIGNTITFKSKNFDFEKAFVEGFGNIKKIRFNVEGDKVTVTCPKKYGIVPPSTWD